MLPDDVGDVRVGLLTAAVPRDVVVRTERLQAELPVLLVVGHVARPGRVGMVEVQLTLQSSPPQSHTSSVLPHSRRMSRMPTSVGSPGCRRENILQKYCRRT